MARTEGFRALIGCGSGIALFALGVRPTGTVPVDLVALPLACAIVIVVAASAPWWALAASTSLAACLSGGLVGVTAGVLGLLASFGVGLSKQDLGEVRTVVVATTLVVLGTVRELRWFGMSTYVSSAVVVLLVVAGWSCLPVSRRRQALSGLGIALGVLTVGTTVVLLAAASVRVDLTDGEQAARRGIAALKRGDFDAARMEFARADNALDRANSGLSGFWAQPARLIPVLSQHRQAAADLSSGAGRATEAISKELGSVDSQQLRVVDGQFDLSRIRSLRTSLTNVQSALRRLSEELDAVDRSWLIPRLSSRVVALSEDVSEQVGLASRLDGALEVAPALLGAEDRRVYLLMFTTQGEARGSGGFMGNWAELTVEDGRIEMTAFGNDEVLNRGGGRPRRLLNAPDDWMANWSRYGFRLGPDESVGLVPWKNITMSPHFPSVARVAAELYPQSGGQPVDAVFNLDVTALAGLIGLVEPLDVEGSPMVFTGDNALGFLLRGQYEETDNLARGDLLADVAQTVVTKLLEQTSPDLIEIGRALAPLAQRGHIMAWAERPAEQRVFDDGGLDGALPEDLPERTEIVLVANNAAANKLDSLINYRYEYKARGDGTAELTVSIENSAPTDQLPDYIAGNRVGLPRGDTRLLISVYSDLTVESVKVAGRAVEAKSGIERGLGVKTVTVDVPHNVGARLTVELSGGCSACEVHVEVRPAGLESDGVIG